MLKSKAFDDSETPGPLIDESATAHGQTHIHEPGQTGQSAQTQPKKSKNNTYMAKFSANACFSFLGVNALFAFVGLNAICSFVAVNSFFSMFSINSVMSFASLNCVLCFACTASVGCINGVSVSDVMNNIEDM